MIELSIDGHVAVVTLNNPAANTFTAAGLLRLTELVGELNRDMNIYALVVTGHGEKFFSAAMRSQADLNCFRQSASVTLGFFARSVSNWA